MSAKQEHRNQSIRALLCDETWSNSACCGYVLFAAKSLGYSKEQKDELITAVNDAFGNYSVEEAKRKYEHSLGNF